MNQFAQALGSKFIEHKEEIRIRTFELGGHTFKVKVPLTSEYELMQKKMNVPDDETIEKYYQEITKDLIANKEKFINEDGIKYTENDIIVKDKSLREAARNKAVTESRITALFKLLVPEEKDFDMDTITYQMIEELFPFPVQIQIIDAIGETIAPDYSTNRGK
jgi:hypothetical protein